jgi:hypothetical protein
MSENPFESPSALPPQPPATRIFRKRRESFRKQMPRMAVFSAILFSSMLALTYLLGEQSNATNIVFLIVISFVGAHITRVLIPENS